MKFNVNDRVRIKLNEHGLRLHRADWERWTSEAGLSRKYTPPVIDEHGYSSFQLWHVMELFGPHMGLGLECPFDPEIKLAGD